MIKNGTSRSTNRYLLIRHKIKEKKVLQCVCKLSVLITYIKIMMYGSTTSSSGNSLCTWTHPIVASEL